jgi:hypothetical protein
VNSFAAQAYCSSVPQVRPVAPLFASGEPRRTKPRFLIQLSTFMLPTCYMPAIKAQAGVVSYSMLGGLASGDDEYREAGEKSTATAALLEVR